VLHEPAGLPRGGVVVCHPHPQYGGDMDSSVVVAVVDALVDAGFVALRFNFGGVGESEGTYDRGREEQCDVGAAVATLAARVAPDVPVAIAGYSFGAWVGAMAAQGLPRVSRVVVIAPPIGLFEWDFAGTLRARLAVVAGDHDQFCPPEALRKLVADVGMPATVLAGADHFFGGRAREVGSAVVAHLVAA